VNDGNWGMGMSHVRIGKTIDNYTGPATSGSAGMYNDFTSQVATVGPCDDVEFSISSSGPTYPSYVVIYVDWNKDGTFETYGDERMAEQRVENGATWSGKFQVPEGTSLGSYRIRIVGDYGDGWISEPCRVQYTGDVEDYTLSIVAGTTPDIMLSKLIAPDPVQIGSNPITVEVSNKSGVTLNSATFGYKLGNSPAVTQVINFTTSLGACESQEVELSTPLNFTGGFHTFKVWATRPNGTYPDGNVNNDTLTTIACTPLSGVYTIDPAGSGITNFVSFAAAAEALTKCGINGPTTFNVAGVTFEEQVSIPAVNGSSAANTITFKGAGRGNTVLSSGNQVSGRPHTLAFNGSSYVRFRDMTIRSTSTSTAWTVHFMGNGINNNQLTNCDIECFGGGSNATSTTFYPVVFSNSTSSATTNLTFTNNRIDSCNISGGYTGIQIYGTTTSGSNLGNVFSNNTITNFYYYGIYAYYLSEIKVMNNTVIKRTSGSYTTAGYGLYFTGSGISYPNYHEISGNIVQDCGQYGMYFSSVNGTVGGRSRVYNNIIGGGFQTTTIYGMYFTSCSWFNIYHNSINMDFPTATTSTAMYFNGGANTFNMDVRNNMLQVNSSAAEAWPLWSSVSTCFSDLDYNNYYKAGTGTNLIYLGTAVPKAGMNGAYGLNTNSYALQAPYMAPKNLRYENGCIRGIQISQVPKDLEGVSRSSSPNVGAYEFTSMVANDLGVLRIIPPATVSLGLIDISVVLRNYGNNIVTSATISYTVNGTDEKTINWSGSLPPCGEVTVTFTGANRAMISPGVNLVRAYTSSPNGEADPVILNDAAELRICPPMAGVYTIDPNGSGASNFLSFTAAVDALTCGGMTGPVTFNVGEGVYSEQIALRGIPGLSVVNTLTIDGGNGNAASRVLVFSGSQNTSRHTLLIDNQSYITIRNLTIRNQSTSYGWPLHIFGVSTDITVSNCQIDMNGGPGEYGTNDNYIPVVINGNATSATSTANFSRITINNNVISGGYRGICAAGSSNSTVMNNVFTNNVITNSQFYAIYFANMNGVRANNNTITMRPGSNSYGIYFSSVTNSGTGINEVIGNKITYAGQYALYFTSSSGNATIRGVIANNMLGGGFFSTSAQGIYMASSSYWDIFHNSVNVDNLVSSTTATALYTTSCNYLDIRNNHFALTHPNLNNGNIFPIYMNTNSTGITCDYNNYFKYGNTNNFVRIQGTTFNAANFVGGVVGGITYNANSVFQNPYYNSNFDLHTNNGCGVGVQIASITSDIDGDARNTPPSIGADEGVERDLAVVSFINPTGTAISGTKDISFTVKNTGRVPLTSFTVGYDINGAATVTENWSDALNPLNPCDSMVFTFSGAQAAEIPASGAISIRVFAAKPNGSADNKTENDTLSRIFCSAPLSGTYAINGSRTSALNTFPSFGSLLNNINACTMDGDIQVNVAPGTYVEQVLIPNTLPGLTGHSILFDGGDYNTTKLTFNAGTYTVYLNGADHITFRNMAIENTGTSSAIAVLLSNAADSNTFDRCKISVPTISNTTVMAYTIQHPTSYSSGGNWGNYNVLSNSKVSGGYFTINVYGTGTGAADAARSTGNKFLFNEISGGSAYGVQTWYTRGIDFIGNKFSSFGSSYGLYLYYPDACVISRNEFKNFTSSYAVYIQYLGNTGTNGVRSTVENNIVTGTLGTGSQNGILINNLGNTDIQHNSVYMGSNLTGAAQCYNISGGLAGTVTFRNNIGWNASTTGYAFYNTGGLGIFSELDHNIFHSTGTNYVYSNNANVTDIYTWRGLAPAFNQNSHDVQPTFINRDQDLHIRQDVAPIYGDVSVSTLVDFDGDARCPMAKTIGADESTFSPGGELKAMFSMPDTAYVNNTFHTINAALPLDLKRHEWDFGNDNSIEDTTLNASYFFTSPGLKEVKLKTIGCSTADSIVKTIRVVVPTKAPVADFITDRYEVGPYEPFVLTDLSINGATSWFWEINPADPVGFFNDYEQNPEVLLGTPGKYTVCLTASNSVGQSERVCKQDYITVKAMTQMCIGEAITESATGEIYDSGGKDFPYGVNENCNFLIAPCATTVTLRFTEFQLDNTAHFLKVHDGRDENAPLIGLFSSNSGLPGGTNGLTAYSGAMYLVWSTSAIGTAPGFAARWTSTPKGNAVVAVGFSAPDSSYENEEVHFESTSIGEGLMYEWDLNGDGFIDATTKNASYTYLTPGTYFPALSIRDACGNAMTYTDTLRVIEPLEVPGADFYADVLVASVWDTVKFTDISTFGPSSWNYSFSPATAAVVGGNSKNPHVIFNQTGVYEVTLEATNRVGTGTETKTAYIRVVDICLPEITGGLHKDVGINRVKLAQLDNSSTSGDLGYTSYFGSASVQPALLDVGGTYEIAVYRNTTHNRANRKIWIDYNGNGVFTDPGELIAEEGSSLDPVFYHTFTVPSSVTRGAARMRVGISFADSTNEVCGPNFYGEVEEYRVVLSDDNTPPVITMLGESPVVVEIGNTYTDMGATAFDAVDGDLTSEIVAVSNVNTFVSGEYTVRYNVEDASGNRAVEVSRTVVVTKDNTPPIITLSAPLIATVPVGGTFVEPGYIAYDAIAGNLTPRVVVDDSDLDLSRVGSYNVVYSVTDDENNSATRTRIVQVIDLVSPEIVLNGNSEIEIEVFTPFVDPGVTVTDNHDNTIFASVTSNLDVNVVGDYTIRYTSVDSSGNRATITRSVKVVDKTAPTIQVLGAATTVVDVFGHYAMPAVSVFDNYDAIKDITVVRSGSYNLNELGEYTISFKAVDKSGNESASVDRIIRVVDRVAPVITLKGDYLITIMRWTPYSDPGVTVTDNYYPGSVLEVAPAFETFGNVNTSEEGLYYVTYDVTDPSGNKAQQVVRAVNVVANTTSIKGIEGVMDINMYPNPANNTVTFELVNDNFNNASIELVNALGQTVKTVVPDNFVMKQAMDISDFSAGVYHVKVINEGKVAILRLVISK
jgi:parallel beta-helix repeat protein